MSEGAWFALFLALEVTLVWLLHVHTRRTSRARQLDDAYWEERRRSDFEEGSEQ